MRLGEQPVKFNGKFKTLRCIELARFKVFTAMHIEALILRVVTQCSDVKMFRMTFLPSSSG
jgi:hypothetical protein